MPQPTRLMNKNFLLLWQGQSINRLGLQAFAVAMLFWIKHATNSATLMGLLLMLSTLPGVLFSPLGGALADRVSRRRILVVTDILSGLAVLTLAGPLSWAAPQSTNMILIWLFIVSLATPSWAPFSRPPSRRPCPISCRSTGGRGQLARSSSPARSRLCRAGASAGCSIACWALPFSF